MYLTYDETVDALNKAAEKKGRDYIYPLARSEQACRYFEPDGQPSCIIGHVIADVGDETDVHETKMWNESSVQSLHSRGVIRADENTMILLETVQHYQDMGTPWGFAIENAL